ncbi:MAG TPA: family 20 glycosylhydrolase [Bacteroidales bacterium]|jgi:hexosaminidase|nr:family 20 glycosylhydrolase [Bacteroidales bacterium]
MKTLYCYLLLIVLLFAYSCQGDNNTTDLVQLIPFPNKIEIGRDSLDISSGFKLNFAEVTPGTESNAKSEIESNLTEYLGSTALNISDSGVEVKVSLNTNYANDSQLLNSSNKASDSKKSSETQKRHDTNISNYSNSSNSSNTLYNSDSWGHSYLLNESYTISVNKKGINIAAASEAGLFYAIQTLIQLTEQNPDKLPFIEIEDSPRFAYRGIHLDVSRHFFSLDFLKKQIDMMAHYKLNYFHWHLTDGPGWRIEIKQYPELTNIAAWRTHSLWKEWWASGRKYTNESDPNAYGGYYTQEEARELVEYAAKRHITIIPEIEMPGHSEEVLAVYPHLACTGKPYTSSEFCIGNEETFVFLENILDEILDIFSSAYIHIGGDEASKEHWKKCPKCQERIKKENLKDEAELQSYLIKRIETYLHSKGRELIGWDEILEGGLEKSAIVMNWRDEKIGIEAAQSGHKVIMTPGKYTYFNSYQSSPEKEPEALGGFLPLENVYAYNPVPDSLSANETDKIWGVQACLWTEYVPTEEHAEYMLYPRMLALAEVAWTNPDNKSWESFNYRVNRSVPILQQKGYNTFTLSKEPEILMENDSLNKAIAIALKSEIYPVEIRYTTEGSAVTSESQLYEGPILIRDSANLKAQLFRDGQPLGDVIEQRIDYHKAIGKKMEYLNPYNRYYPANGETSLIDGLYGGFSHGDGFWQGFIGAPFDAIIDLDEIDSLRHIRINFLQNSNAEIWLPKEITIALSNERKGDFEPVATFNNNILSDKAGTFFKSFEWNGSYQARFIRITATINPAVRGWVFADEIVVW